MPRMGGGPVRRRALRRQSSLIGSGEMAQDLRTTLGVTLAISLLVIFLSGFVVHSSREALFIFFGFGFGVVTVFLIERTKLSRAH